MGSVMLKIWNRDELLRGIAETGGGSNGDKLTTLDEYVLGIPSKV